MAYYDFETNASPKLLIRRKLNEKNKIIFFSALADFN